MEIGEPIRKYTVVPATEPVVAPEPAVKPPPARQPTAPDRREKEPA